MDLKGILDFFILSFITSFCAFSPLIVPLTVFILSWFWSSKFILSVSLVYCYWLYFDRRTDSHGGRWSDWLRRCSIWTHWTQYFPLTLIKSTDLDPNRNYIFGYHPHGVAAIGALGNFGTDATHFSSLFPGIRPHLMLLKMQFFNPFTRDLLLGLGACCVSRNSCEYLLSGKCGQGNALVIIIGGRREVWLTRNNTMILYLKSRKGFIQLALKYGASIVPVISFGENELYERRTFFGLIPNGIPWGLLFMGYIPFRRQVVTVVGKPIHVVQTDNPTPSDIEQLHQDYLQAVEQLFVENKDKYKLGHLNQYPIKDAAKLWVRTTSNGDIIVSILNIIALFKSSDWYFRQTVIRVCSFSNFIHFGCFLYHHYFVQPHHIAFVILYCGAISITLLSGLGWGLNWDRILKRKTQQFDQLQLTTEPSDPLNTT
ncbi:unnamed protein product [Rotaria socialis]|uniref:Acyltransferase n=1 Tax=Rotaria socialis TaxID=392032 RepID=A0A818D610_9BILA|nr:unnamed protein product [Rotaria socialis]